MIAKNHKGNGFRGVLNYAMQEEKGYFLDSNMDGRTPRELAREFGRVRSQREGVENPVNHVSISLPPGEHLTDDQWREVVQAYLKKQGYDENQYVAMRHTDTEHEHIHIIVNRVRTDDLNVTPNSFERYKNEEFCREMEIKYGLTQVKSSFEAERKSKTQGEVARAERTGEKGLREVLQEKCDDAIKASSNYSEYQATLEKNGVEVIPRTQVDDTKLSGLSYRTEEGTMKGSDLGTKYTPKGLGKKGITYEKERDLPAVQAAQAREAVRAAEAEKAAQQAQAEKPKSQKSDAQRRRDNEYRLQKMPEAKLAAHVQKIKPESLDLRVSKRPEVAEALAQRWASQEKATQAKNEFEIAKADKSTPESRLAELREAAQQAREVAQQAEKNAGMKFHAGEKAEAPAHRAAVARWESAREILNQRVQKREQNQQQQGKEKQQAR